MVLVDIVHSSCTLRCSCGLTSSPPPTPSVFFLPQALLSALQRGRLNCVTLRACLLYRFGPQQLLELNCFRCPYVLTHASCYPLFSPCITVSLYSALSVRTGVMLECYTKHIRALVALELLMARVALDVLHVLSFLYLLHTLVFMEPHAK
jgi:hypothetical protein